MKKILCLMLCAIMMLMCCACGNTSDDGTTEEATTEAPEVIPTVKIVVNGSKDDTTTDMRIFPGSRDRKGVYVHYYIESEKEEETIRIKREDRWGADEQVKKEFEVDADNITTVKTNNWNYVYLTASASNLYFYRVTLYYGEKDIVLGTATVYTPYKTASYTADDFKDEAPEFHAFDGLNEDEQKFYDACQEAVLYYAKSNNFDKVNDIKAWQGAERLYLYVEYVVSSKYKTVWFYVSNEDYGSFRASTSASAVIPDGEGTADQIVLADYFYVVKELNKGLEE